MGRTKRGKTNRVSEAPSGTAPRPKARPSPANVLAGCVTALFVLRPLYPSESVAAEGDGLPVVMLWLLLLAFWAILVARGSLTRVRFTWPDMAVALLVAWHSLAALWAVAFESPRPALNMLWEWLAVGVAYFLARQAFRTGIQRRAVAGAMIALAVAISCYGVYQYSVELPATRALYEQSSDEMLRDAGLWFPPGSPERDAFEQRLASLEPMATFALTNSLAGFLTTWAIVVIGICVVPGTRLNTMQRIGIASTLLPIGLCLLLTKSRSAYLASAFGVAAIVAVWWIRQRTQVQLRRGLPVAALVAALIAVAILGTFLAGGLDAEVLSEAPKSLGYRLQYWQSSWDMIRDMPILGCGPGNFHYHYTAYKLPEASEEIKDPHNFLIEIWATAGTPAMLALLGLFGAVGLGLRRSASQVGDGSPNHAETADPARPALSAIGLGAFAGVILSLPIGAMSSAPPGWLVPLAAIPLGAVALAILSPWLTRGNDAPSLWMLAAIALLIHLSFAGGIGYPGVAGSLWLLVALALNATECADRPMPARGGLAVLVPALVLLAACFLTGYQPTLTARTLTQKAYSGYGDPQALLQKAAAADPWAVQPRKHLADLLYQKSLVAGHEAVIGQYERMVQEALARAPRAASLHHQFGLAYRDLYQQSQNKQLLSRAVQLLETAASLYPNSARIRADLAEAHLMAGDPAKYRQERAAALRLDELTPHLDKKLSTEQRQRLQRNTLAPEVRAPYRDQGGGK